MAREMKESGIPWIGEIPATWERRRFKDIMLSSNGGEVIDKNYWGNGDEILYTCQKTPMASDYPYFPDDKRTQKGDLLLTRNATPYIFIPEEGAIYSNVVQRVKLIDGCERRYVKNAEMFGAGTLLVNGNTIPSYNMEVWRNIVIPWPPLQEQIRIADFLDAKCALIDDITEKTGASIEEYKKLKQSMITEAVTKGIRPGRKMKDSGIQWIGEIPEDWSILKLHYLCEMQAGKNITSESIAPEGKFPVYGGNGLRGYYEEYNTEGDFLLVGRQGALCGNVHRVSGRFWATEHAVITTPSTLSDIGFLYYLLVGMNLNQYVNNTAAQPGLAVSQIQRVRTCLVPLEEQREIAQYLDEKCGAIDVLLEQKTRLITELESYKKSLIYEYVTGKKEVPAAE